MIFDDYNVKTVDAARRSISTIAHFSNFVPHNGRRVAGYADTVGHSPQIVSVVPIVGGRCFAVPETEPTTTRR